MGIIPKGLSSGHISTFRLRIQQYRQNYVTVLVFTLEHQTCLILAGNPWRKTFVYKETCEAQSTSAVSCRCHLFIPIFSHSSTFISTQLAGSKYQPNWHLQSWLQTRRSSSSKLSRAISGSGGLGHRDSSCVAGLWHVFFLKNCGINVCCKWQSYVCNGLL